MGKRNRVTDTIIIVFPNKKWFGCGKSAASSGEMVRIVNGELVDDSAPAPASGPLAFASGMSMGAGMLLRACVCLLAHTYAAACVRVLACAGVRVCERA